MRSRAAKLLALLLAVTALVQATPPPPPPPGPSPGPVGGSGGSGGGSRNQGHISLLRELGCRRSQVGYLCDGSTLEDFEEYEWSHPDLMSFARKFRDAYYRLAQEVDRSKGSIRIALQGEADSQEIHKFKLWNEVDAKLGRREGKKPFDQVTNSDLAWLRSRTLYKVLRQLFPSAEIQVLKPVAHKLPDQKTGRYRAAKIYIVVEVPN